MSQLKTYKGFGQEPQRKQSDYERRVEARYPLEIELIIFSGKDFVRAKTTNVSTSGLQLAIPLPEAFRKSHLEIVLSGEESEESKHELMLGKVVDERGTHIRLDTPFRNLE